MIKTFGNCAVTVLVITVVSKINNIGFIIINAFKNLFGYQMNSNDP